MNEQAEIERLTELAYRYFPKGIPDDDKGYAESKESMARKELFVSRNSYMDIIDQIAKDFCSLNRNFQFQNISEFLSHDRCVKTRFIATDQSIKNNIVVYISYFVPYYVIYGSANNVKFDSFSDYLNNSHVSLTFSEPQLTRAAREIENIIKQQLPTYQAFPISY